MTRLVQPAPRRRACCCACCACCAARPAGAPAPGRRRARPHAVRGAAQAARQVSSSPPPPKPWRRATQQRLCCVFAGATGRCTAAAGQRGSPAQGGKGAGCADAGGRSWPGLLATLTADAANIALAARWRARGRATWLQRRGCVPLRVRVARQAAGERQPHVRGPGCVALQAGHLLLRACACVCRGGAQGFASVWTPRRVQKLVGGPAPLALTCCAAGLALAAPH